MKSIYKLPQHCNYNLFEPVGLQKKVDLQHNEIIISSYDCLDASLEKCTKANLFLVKLKLPKIIILLQRQKIAKSKQLVLDCRASMSPSYQVLDQDDVNTANRGRLAEAARSLIRQLDEHLHISSGYRRVQKALRRQSHRRRQGRKRHSSQETLLSERDKICSDPNGPANCGSCKPSPTGSPPLSSKRTKK